MCGPSVRQGQVQLDPKFELVRLRNSVKRWPWSWGESINSWKYCLHVHAILQLFGVLSIFIYASAENEKNSIEKKLYANHFRKAINKQTQTCVYITIRLNESRRLEISKNEFEFPTTTTRSTFHPTRLRLIITKKKRNQNSTDSITVKDHFRSLDTIDPCIHTCALT